MMMMVMMMVIDNDDGEKIRSIVFHEGIIFISDNTELPQAKEMRVERKRFYFDCGRNNRGSFLRISEVCPHHFHYFNPLIHYYSLIDKLYLLVNLGPSKYRQNERDLKSTKLWNRMSVHIMDAFRNLSSL